MMNSVAPVWDGNETWLVLGGAGLFGAFPLAYAVITRCANDSAHRHVNWSDLSRRRLRISF
ncbi:Cytochrome bd2 [Klebsiella michiganensis]|nr:Cytochrome bd2 [Klebsiella michiganensis]